MIGRSHPDRPKMPTRPPMVGDGTRAVWDDWREACLRCEHSSKRQGCIRLGIVQYEGSLRWFGMPLPAGGCTAWSPRPNGERLVLAPRRRRS